MPAVGGLPYLREVLLFLVLAGVLIPLLQRMRVNQVLGFLAVGALLGPFGLGQVAAPDSWASYLTFPRPEGVAVLAELGVVFLLFRIGLELSFERLVAMRRQVFGVGVAQVLLSALAIGAVARSFGNTDNASIVLGLVLALSSTAVVVQLLSDRRAMGTPVGRGTFAVLLLQDLAVVPLLILVGVLAGGSSAQLPALLGMALLKALLAIGAIYVLGRRVIRPLFANFASGHQPDVFMALTLLATLGISALTWMAGLSMALGAFLAGVLLAETEFRHQVEVTVEPFRGLLLGLFFMSIGMGIDPQAALSQPFWIVSAAIGLLLIKAAIATPLLRAGGLAWPQAMHAGLLLGQGGEFAFIVVGAAMASGLIAGATGQFMLAVVGLTLFMTPLSDRLGRWLVERLEAAVAPAAEAAELPELRDHVVLAGFGRVGQLLAGLLDSQRIPWVALDVDTAVVGAFHRAGRPVYFGDASRVELLERMHLGECLAVVLTMDQPDAAIAAVRSIRGRFAALVVLARSRDEAHALALRNAGATDVVPETLASGLQLGQRVLERIGVSALTASAAVAAERERREG
jgi:CPA2 family monovalent cation:H+ antiporter-2